MLEQKKYSKIYFPKKNDKIDYALANFINTYPDRENMNVQFVHISRGLYQFGQRQINIKVLKGNKVYV